MNFAIKARAEQVYLFCRAVAKSRHYEVLPQKYGALRARLIKGTMGTEGTEGTEGIMGIMGLFPEIPAFPEIPENSPKKKVGCSLSITD